MGLIESLGLMKWLHRLKIRMGRKVCMKQGHTVKTTNGPWLELEGVGKRRLNCHWCTRCEILNMEQEYVNEILD